MCSLRLFHYLGQEVCQMNRLDQFIRDITRDAHNIGNEQTKEIAEDVRDTLRNYATAHRKTGELARNIRLIDEHKRDMAVYRVDASTRTDYTDKSYHAMTFFTYDPAKRALANILKKYR